MNCSRRPAKQVCETAGCRVTLLRCGLIDATLSSCLWRGRRHFASQLRARASRIGDNPGQLHRPAQHDRRDPP